MAHRALRLYPQKIFKESNKIKQHFNHLLVVDFEATCEDGKLLVPQEIIEFPCVALSTDDWEVKNVFHRYIKPRVHPEITPFCSSLTGIIQEMVNDEPHFPEVFERFCSWLKEHGYSDEASKSAFVTCGDWDLNVMLPNQCALDDVTVPENFKQWINLKNTFCEFTQYYPRSLKDMLGRLDIRLTGRLHSGIDDVQNMVKIMKKLQEQHNANFKITSSLKGSGNNSS